MFLGQGQFPGWKTRIGSLWNRPINAALFPQWKTLEAACFQPEDYRK